METEPPDSELLAEYVYAIGVQPPAERRGRGGDVLEEAVLHPERQVGVVEVLAGRRGHRRGVRQHVRVPAVLRAVVHGDGAAAGPGHAGRRLPALLVRDPRHRRALPHRLQRDRPPILR